MHNKVIGILEYALEMELSGHNFFKEKAEVFQSPTTKELFLNLAEIEMQHYTLIKRELDAYTKDPVNYVVDEEVMTRDEGTIFDQRESSESLDTTLIESDVPDLTIMRMAYLIERDFKEFYAGAVEQVDAQNIKVLLTRLSNWESGHEQIFKREYDRLKKEYMNLPWGG